MNVSSYFFCFLADLTDSVFGLCQDTRPQPLSIPVANSVAAVAELRSGYKRDIIWAHKQRKHKVGRSQKVTFTRILSAEN